MSEIEAQDSVSLRDNPAAWIEKTLGRAEEEQTNGQEGTAPQEAPTPTTEAEAPAASLTDWREIPIPDDDPELKGRFRKTGDVAKSYRELESKFHQRDKEIAELRAEVAARRTFEEMTRSQQAPQAPAAPIDPWKTRGVDPATEIWNEPEKILRTQEEILAERAAQITDAKLREYEFARAKREREIAQIRAMEAAREELKLTPDDWREVVPAIALSVVQRKGEEALFDKSSIVEGFREFTKRFGAPVADSAPPPVPQPQANPPGAKRPATQAQGNEPAYALGAEADAFVSSYLDAKRISDPAQREAFKRRYAEQLKNARNR